MKCTHAITFFTAAALMLSGIGVATAQTPLSTAFTYQGELANGAALATGTHDLRFRLYSAASGGSPIGSTLCADNLLVTNGRFAASLDFGAAFTGEKQFLEIEVRRDTGQNCSDNSGYTVLSPRQELTATPNANFATIAGSAASAANATSLNGQLAFFYTNAANLTGTVPASSLFGVSGSGLTALDATSISSGTLSTQRLPLPLGLSGTSPGTGIISGANSGANGSGVNGFATAISGQSTGVLGESNSTSGYGVHGIVRGVSGQTIGVRGDSFSTGGLGVYGSALAVSGQTSGVRGESASNTGTGVSGFATANSGQNIGIRGDTLSTSGTGVFGYADAASGTTYGVYGTVRSTDGWGLYAAGRSGASGTKSFRIDHPADPENKYLLHYSVESPEVINFYSGKITLDDMGEATVELPAYFASINKDPRYTLTPIGAPMPLLHVAEEISEIALKAGEQAKPGETVPTCSFRIAGGAPWAKVSWRVEGVRNDLWVRTRGAPVQAEKGALEKGTYQHPELYGQPKERGINYFQRRSEPAAVDAISRASGR